MKNVHWRLKRAAGFSVIDMVVTVAVIGIVAAIAVPQAADALDRMRLGMAERDVEREMQFARLKAVSANRPMRVRFDCPAPTQFRAVELIGTSAAPDAADADTTAAGVARCSETAYPYSPTGADKSRLTRPNNDGPLRTLDATARTSSSRPCLDFLGPCRSMCDGAPAPPAAGAAAGLGLLAPEYWRRMLRSYEERGEPRRTRLLAP